MKTISSLKHLIWSQFNDFIKLSTQKSPYPKTEYLEESASTRFLSNLPSPLYNGIIQKKPLTPTLFNSQFKKLNRCDLPFSWWIDPQMDSKILEENHLMPAGIYNGLAAPVKQLDLSPTEGISAQEVTTKKEFIEWGTTIGAVFGFEGDFLNAFLHILSEFGPGKSLRHYLARRDGKPIGAMTLYCTQEVCGIWNAGTIVEARRQGAATLLAKMCMNEAHRLGYNTMITILMSGGLAKGICTKLGFEEICQMAPYIYLEPTQ